MSAAVTAVPWNLGARDGVPYWPAGQLVGEVVQLACIASRWIVGTGHVCSRSGVLRGL
jgi:hypothetical protein